MKDIPVPIKTTTNDQLQIEKLLIMNRMKDFDPNKGRVNDMFMNMFGYVPTREQLLSLARVVSIYLHLQLDREAFRRKEVLIKWYDEHYETVFPFIQNHIKIEGIEVEKPKRTKTKQEFNYKAPNMYNYYARY